MTTISEAWAIAIGHHQAGRLQQAEQIYRQILAVDQSHSDAWNLLGVTNSQCGNHQVALDCIGRAIKLNASAAAYHSNLGNAYQALQRQDEAAVCYRRALELKPDYANAHHNLATVLQEQGKRHEAIASYRRALELMPDFTDAQYNLGNALYEQGQKEEAIDCYRRALQTKPNFAEAHYNLGNALWEHESREEAIDCYRRALQLKPDFADARYNLANALREQGSLDEAVACYRRVLQFKPEFADAHYNLGSVLQEQGKRCEAVACYRDALATKPDFTEAYGNLGNALREIGKWDEADASFRRELELEPHLADAHYNLGGVFQDQGKLDAAVACYRRALELNPRSIVATGALVHQLQHLCQWEDLEELSRRVTAVVEQDTQDVIATPVAPLVFVALPTSTTAQQQLQCARQWADRHVKVLGESGRSWSHNRLPHRTSKLAVGYLSADFRLHATTMLIAELFEKHDRDRFVIFGYSYGPDDGSEMRWRLVRAFDRFAELKESSFLDSAQRIAADKIDILVDLTGYTMNARTQIMALRPAPVQVNYLGYPGTMGAPFMDYILVDDFIVPPDQQPFYTEKLVHLPGCYQVNDSQRQIALCTPSRAESGLPEEGFVFCYFNNNYKITPAVFSVWMKLLTAVPGSVLWLLEGNSFAAANLCREAEARGVAAQRLVFAPRIDMTDHLARHRLANLFLDTFPYNAHTTASEALWAGCPVLTMAGETFVSRVAGSLLRSVGLPELVTTNLDDYQALALRLARDPQQLAELRARLQTNRTTSSLFDGGRFAKSLERAYLTMWDIYASREQPRTFRVDTT